MIVVNPEYFDNAVSCIADPGGMQVYVATLFDVTPDQQAAAPSLPSSPPTACTTQVGFGYVEPGRQYRAEIDAYDRSDLTPLTPGNRLLQRAGSSGELIAPRWRASCGNPVTTEAGALDPNLGFFAGPARASLNASVTVMGCTPFVDGASSPGDTAIRIDLGAALGDLNCGSSPGQVFNYTVQRQGGSEPSFTSACDEPVIFSDLTPGQTYFFEIYAFESSASVGDPSADASASDASVTDASVTTNTDSGSDADSVMGDATTADAGSEAVALGARWQTSCYQRALQGVERAAVCDPLAPIP